MRTTALDFPKSVLIETCNLCQGMCKFCPYPELRKNEDITFLSDEIVESLFNELKEHNVNRLTLFNNNEPLLDKRIYKFIVLAHKKMPNIEITLSSNGRLITKGILDKLYKCGLTTLYISIPCVERENYKNIMGTYPDKLFSVLNDVFEEHLIKMIRIAVPITKYLDEQQIRSKFKNFIVCTWNLEYKKSWCIGDKFFDIATDKSFAGECDRPMDQAVISSNGNVLICCRDWQEQNVVGNVYEKTLSEIWKGEEMKKIQELISNKQYSLIKCCSDCIIDCEAYKR